VLISDKALDLIVMEEVESRAAYAKTYCHTEWPGGGSGVTIGIGYDVGQDNVAGLRQIWAGEIPDGMVKALERACGITGLRAKDLSAELFDQITIPWDTALRVFTEKDLPRYERDVQKLPNWDMLSRDSYGALVSLVYNRGASFDHKRDPNDPNDRYREMREIKAHMASLAFENVPDEFRRMKRLWIGHGLDGLLARRDKEAALFEAGIGGTPIHKLTPLPPAVPGPQAETLSLWRVLADLVGYLFAGKGRK
jgi:hypothetical protein